MLFTGLSTSVTSLPMSAPKSVFFEKMQWSLLKNMRIEVFRKISALLFNGTAHKSMWVTVIFLPLQLTSKPPSTNQNEAFPRFFSDHLCRYSPRNWVVPQYLAQPQLHISRRSPDLQLNRYSYPMHPDSGHRRPDFYRKRKRSELHVCVAAILVQ